MRCVGETIRCALSETAEVDTALLSRGHQHPDPSKSLVSTGTCSRDSKVWNARGVLSSAALGMDSVEDLRGVLRTGGCESIVPGRVSGTLCTC